MHFSCSALISLSCYWIIFHRKIWLRTIYDRLPSATLPTNIDGKTIEFQENMMGNWILLQTYGRCPNWSDRSIRPGMQQQSGQSSFGPSALRGEPRHSTPSSSLSGSLSGEQQHAECLMPGPSSKSGECSHSASKTDELPGSSPGLQHHSVHSVSGPSSRPSGEQQQDLDPAAAGGSPPTEQQNSGKSWDSIFRPTGWPGKWQLRSPFRMVARAFPRGLVACRRLTANAEAEIELTD